VACGGREQGVDRRAVQVPVRALVVPRERGARARHLVLVVAGGGGGQGRGLFGSGGRERGGSGRGGLGVARPILAWIPCRACHVMKGLRCLLTGRVTRPIVSLPHP